MLVFLPVGFGNPARGEEVLELGGEEISEHDRFRLWNNCKPIDLVVEDLHYGAASIGLVKNDIETTVLNRLRYARLYSQDVSGVFLQVQMGVSGSAFSNHVSFHKIVRDLASGLSSSTETWSVGSVGTHGAKNADFILSSISQHTDKFIDEYLRVNESACE